MVSFVCDKCQETIKKPKLDQHRQRCWATFTCIDCSTTFQGTDYKSHTSCISEAEKYEKSFYKGPKKSVAKNGNSKLENSSLSGLPSSIPSSSEMPIPIIAQLKKKTTSDVNTNLVNRKHKRKNEQSDSSDSSSHSESPKVRRKIDENNEEEKKQEGEYERDQSKLDKKIKENQKEHAQVPESPRIHMNKDKHKSRQKNGTTKGQSKTKKEKKERDAKKFEDGTVIGNMKWDNKTLDSDYSKTIPLAIRSVLENDTQMTLKLLRRKVIKKFKMHPMNNAKKMVLADQFENNLKILSKNGEVTLLL